MPVERRGWQGDRGIGDTFSAHRGGYRKSTKPYSMTHSSEGEEVSLKSRMREILKSGSVGGLMAAVCGLSSKDGGHESYPTSLTVRT